METIVELKKQKAAAEQSALELDKKIKQIEEANKVPSIMERVTKYMDVLNELGADETKDVISIDKFSEEEINVLKQVAKKM
jgi:hypothetical protein